MTMVRPKEDPVSVKIERVLVSQQEAVVILAPNGDGADFGNKVLPVFVDLGQAMNIQVSLEGRMMGRPLTHDLFTTVLNELSAIVDHVVIEDLAQNTFFATLHVEMDKGGKREKVTFDARPSDCLALAVRSGAKIQVRRKVLEAASVDRDKFFGVRPQIEEFDEGAEEEEEGDEDEDEEGEGGGERRPPRRRGGGIDPGEVERP